MNLLFPKVPSGIPGLDNMIGGGFTKNNLITVSGSTGSGRTTFASQFLVNGFKQNQEPGIYLSFNEPKYSIFANMSAYDWNLPELERNKQVVFIEYPQTELSSFVEQEGSILELIDTLGVERVVFDSITPLAMLSDGDERIRSLQKLVNTIRKWGVTTLITADDITPPDPDLPRTNVGIETMTDGFIHLGWMREGNRRLRTLEVVKMRGSAHAHLIHLTTIDSKGYQLVNAESPQAEKKTSDMMPSGLQAPRNDASAGAAVGAIGQTRPSYPTSTSTRPMDPMASVSQKPAALRMKTIPGVTTIRPMEHHPSARPAGHPPKPSNAAKTSPSSSKPIAPAITTAAPAAKSNTPFPKPPPVKKNLRNPPE